MLSSKKTELPVDTEEERGSGIEEAKLVPSIHGNGRIGLTWIAQRSEFRMTEVNKHQHYHVDVVGCLCLGEGIWTGIIFIGGKPFGALDLTNDGVDFSEETYLDTDLGHTDTVTTRIKVYWGTDDQTMSSFVNNLDPLQTHPSYRGFMIVEFENLYAGEQAPRVPQVEIQVEKQAPYTHNSVTRGAARDGGGVNPANIALSWLTSYEEGIYIPESQVNMDKLDTFRANIEAKATALGALNLARLNPIITRAKKFKDLIGDLNAYYDGFFLFDDEGKIYPWMPKHQYESESNPSQWLEVNEEDFDEDDDPRWDTPNYKHSITGAYTVFYDSNLNFKKNSEHYPAPYMRKYAKGNREETLEREWFVWPDAAKAYGGRYVTIKNSKLWAGMFTIPAWLFKHPDNVNVDASLRGKHIRSGETFIMNSSTFGFRVKAMVKKRKISRSKGTDLISVEWVQEHGQYPTEYLPPKDSEPDKTVYDIPDVSEAHPLELPIWMCPNQKQTFMACISRRPNKRVTGMDMVFDKGAGTLFTGDEYTYEDCQTWGVYFDIAVNVTAGTGTIQVEIPTGKPSADEEVIMSTIANDKTAENDDLLVLFVDGNDITEVCSVSNINETDVGEYTLSIKRGRFETEGVTHLLANEKCYVVKRSEINFLSHFDWKDCFDEHWLNSTAVYDSSTATRKFKIRYKGLLEGSEGDYSSELTVVLRDRTPLAPPSGNLDYDSGNDRSRLSWTIPDKDPWKHYHRMRVYLDSLPSDPTYVYRGSIEGTVFIHDDALDYVSGSSSLYYRIRVEDQNGIIGAHLQLNHVGGGGS